MTGRAPSAPRLVAAAAAALLVVLAGVPLAGCATVAQISAELVERRG